MKKALIICGSTASGKTGLGHSVAKKHNGEIINIDAIQIYKQLPIITATPEIKLQQEVQYHLYSFLDIDQFFSVDKYVKKAKYIMQDILSRDKLPIFVGGTGMYINALMYGYNDIPNIPDNIRHEAREKINSIGNEAFFQELCNMDSKAVHNLNKEDSQRILRAYEVIKHTGKSIFVFQQEQHHMPFPDIKFKVICLLPERVFLHQMIKQRLDQMFEGGVIKEISNFLKQHKREKVSPSAFKALGVQEITDYLDGITTLDKAKELTLYRTRKYAKRQITWFNNQIQYKELIRFASKEEYQEITNNVNLESILVI